MWHWFSEMRRKKILATPFPSDWERRIQNNIPYYQHLNNEKKKAFTGSHSNLYYRKVLVGVQWPRIDR